MVLASGFVSVWKFTKKCVFFAIGLVSIWIRYGVKRSQQKHSISSDAFSNLKFTKGIIMQGEVKKFHLNVLLTMLSKGEKTLLLS